MVSSEGRSFAELCFHEIITGQADRPLLYPARDGQDLLICCKKAFFRWTELVTYDRKMSLYITAQRVMILCVSPCLRDRA